MSDYPSDWNKCLLGERVQFQYGKSPNVVRFPGGEYPIYGSSGKSSEATDFTTESPSIIVGRKGTIDKPIFLEERCWAIDTTFFIDQFPLDDPKYLFYLLDSINLKSLNESTGVPSLSRDALHSIPVSLPPLPEQKKIAKILSGIDDSISKEWQKIKVLLEIRRAFLKNLTFGKGAKAERIDSGTEFGLVPSNWTCEKIPDCCLIENSKRKPIKKEDRSQMRGNYPYHGATRIQDYISEFAYEGEYVLIGEDGDHFSKFDDWEMAQFASGRFNVSNHAHVIKGSDRCRTKWLFYSLLHRDLTLHLTRQGATRFKLSKASLECIPILIPPLEEQDKMINLFDSISGLVELRSKKVEKLNAAKTAIAKDLLSGRKRVSV